MAMTDLIGGTIDIFLIGQSSAKAQIGARLKMLAITSPRRSPLMPDLPTMEEAGVPGYELSACFGLLAPAKTPQDIIDRLFREVKKAAIDPRFIEAVAPQGMEIIVNSPREALAMMKADTLKWGDVVAATGARIKQ
jgi:tripartite-type tricarboxylate transporter receptor subunit TctC